MNTETFEISQNKVIIKLNDRVCETPGEILASPLFRAILERAIDKLVKRNSFLLGVFDRRPVTDETISLFIKTLETLVHTPTHSIEKIVPGGQQFLKDPALFNELIEHV